MATQIFTISFADAELDWLRSKAISDVAVTAYRGEVARLSTFCASIGITEISHIEPGHWIAYVACLSTDRSTISSQWKPLKPSSVLQAFRITKAFLLHCARCQWLDWDPRDIAVPMPSESTSDRRSRIGAPLSPSLRQMLSGVPLATDERQARRHFTLGLGFWGGLSPRELALLKVQNLRISPTTGEGELTCMHRSLPMILPAELGKLWGRYRDCRQDDTNRKIKPTSALIASLRSGDPLCAWSIWALMQAGRSNADEAKEFINPRLLRLAYFESATQNAVRDIDVVRSQIGKTIDSPRVQSAHVRRRILGSLHEATLAKLRVSP